MKKIVLFICFIAILSLCLASISIINDRKTLPLTFSEKTIEKSDPNFKYSDCIDSLKLKRLVEQYQLNQPIDSVLVLEAEKSLINYSHAMDSVVQNLSAVEAHLFLHSAYKEFSERLLVDSLSQKDTYYHLGALRICHKLDASLNSSSEILVRNSK